MFGKFAKPSEVLEKPYIMVGVPVIAAATDAEAKFQATSLQLTFLNLIRGERKLAVPPIDNLETLWTVREKQTVESMLGLLTHGGPEKIRRDLNLLIGQTDADEVIITSEPFEHSARLDSFGYIAQAKSLNIL